jgi:hypothetical protein
MKYIFCILVAAVSILLLFVYACKKEQLGSSNDTSLPDSGPVSGLVPGFPKSSGFFCCSFVQYIPSNFEHQKGQVTAIASFNDPKAYLYNGIDIYSNQLEQSVNGNLNLGKVAFNSYPLPWYSGTYSGTPQTFMTVDTTIVWKVPGTEGVPGFSDQFESPFPLAGPASSASLTTRFSQQCKLQVKDFFTNYDSIFLNVPYNLFARMKPGESYLQLEEKEILKYQPDMTDSIHFAAELKALKYFYSRHSGRTYQYLYITKAPVNLLIIHD